MSVVRIERVFKDYLLGEQIVQAVNDITLAIEPECSLAISGLPGAERRRLNPIGCIDKPTSGKIYINHEDVTEKTPDQLAEPAPDPSASSSRLSNLLPVLSVAENVEYPSAAAQGYLRVGP